MATLYRMQQSTLHHGAFNVSCIFHFECAQRKNKLVSS